MKLELKHLANYLPYKLKIYTPFGFRPNGKESTGVSRVVYLTVDLYADIENNTFQGAVFKPILRPLSDLTKPCLEGGKVPLIELAKIGGLEFTEYKTRTKDGFSGVMFQDDDGDDMVFAYEYDKYMFGSYCMNSKTMHYIPNQLTMFEFLFGNHFDIYNLIQNGLAIDINTIKEDK